MHRLEAGADLADILAPYRDVDRAPPPGRCWVVANMVAGLDGSAAIAGRVGQLSSTTDAALFKLLRSLADVVLVGAETVRRERYGPVRLPEPLRARRRAAGLTDVPPIAVVTRSLELDWSSPLFAAAEAASPTTVLTCAAAPPAGVEEARRHAQVLTAGEDRVDLGAALDALAAAGARTVLCEGGPRLLGELVDARLLQELCLTIEPLMGGDPLPVAVSPASGDPARYRIGHTLRDDDTLFLRYELVAERDGEEGP